MFVLQMHMFNKILIMFGEISVMFHQKTILVL